MRRAGLLPKTDIVGGEALRLQRTSLVSLAMRLRSLIATGLAVVLGLGVGVGASGVTSSSLGERAFVTASESSTRVQAPRRAVIIGDSAMAGVRWNGALAGLRGFDADDRLESCRRLVDPSCRGREGTRPATALVEITQLARPLPDDVLVIAVGYNDLDGRFAAQSRTVLDAAVARGFSTIAWVTYREDVAYSLPSATERAMSNYRNMNLELRAIDASGEYPALQLWDLQAYTATTSTWFHNDGVHQQIYGSWAVADWLSRQMAALGGEPCPVPWTPTYPHEEVCPDPNSLVGVRGHPSIGLLYDF